MHLLYTVAGMALVYGLQYIPILGIGSDAVLGFFIGLAMPTAGLASVFADQYGGDTENAVILTLGTTVLSIVTIPVLYWLLRMVV